MDREIIGYAVIKSMTGKTLRNFEPSEKGKRAAYRFADRVDNEYGAVCCVMYPMYRGERA